MNMLKKLSLLLLLGLAVAGTYACPESDDGPAERAGEKVDDAAEDAGDKLEDAGDKMEDAADKAEDAVDSSDD